MRQGKSNWLGWNGSFIFVLPGLALRIEPPVWAPCRQPASRKRLQPQESLLSCCVCSFAPHTHPSCLVGLSNPGSPPSLLPLFIVPHPHLPPPLPRLFLRSTGLVKVSQSLVAPLYRLQRFLLKWWLLSCEFTHVKSGWVVRRHRLPSSFV